MARKGGMKGRPGILFVVFIFVCVVLFYFSWQMLMSPRYDTKQPKRNGVNSGIKLSSLYGIDRSSHMGNQYENPWIRKDQGKDQNKYEPNDASKPIGLQDKSVNDKKPMIDIDEENPPSITTVKSPQSNDMKQKDDLQPKPFTNDESLFYMDPIPSIEESLKSMHRLVHLDFKGAVPKLKYLREVLPLVKSLGATGLLVEYEDMFPFNGTIQHLKAADAFTMKQIEEFLEAAKSKGLVVIPLIQTFGHMEFVLKSAFARLRESSYTPQVLDMTNDHSYTLISEMVKQVLDSHPDSFYLHVGCDEVYELGKGASAAVMSRDKLSRGQMYLKHVKKVAQIVSDYRPRKVKPIIWDDMLRQISLGDISASSLPSLVEVMIWHYTPDVPSYVEADVFAKYEKLFESVWIASSFKGATGSRQFYTEPRYHIRNHFSWLTVIADHHKNIQFKGIALTGWQRYDHFATLCELLPVAVPSLAVCLATMVNGGFTEAIHASTSKILKCDSKIDMTFPGDMRTQDCSFPGSDIYYAMQDFYSSTKKNVNHRVEGWLSDYQVSHGFSNPGQLKVLAMDINRLNNGLTTSEGPLKLHLSSIYSQDVVDEWLDENIYERKRRNNEVLEKVNLLMNQKVWPRRPLPPLAAKTQGSGGVQNWNVGKNSTNSVVGSNDGNKQPSGSNNYNPASGDSRKGGTVLKENPQDEPKKDLKDLSSSVHNKVEDQPEETHANNSPVVERKDSAVVKPAVGAKDVSDLIVNRGQKDQGPVANPVDGKSQNNMQQSKTSGEDIKESRLDRKLIESSINVSEEAPGYNESKTSKYNQEGGQTENEDSMQNTRYFKPVKNDIKNLSAKDLEEGLKHDKVENVKSKAQDGSQRFEDDLPKNQDPVINDQQMKLKNQGSRPNVQEHKARDQNSGLNNEIHLKSYQQEELPMSYNQAQNANDKNIVANKLNTKLEDKNTYSGNNTMIDKKYLDVQSLHSGLVQNPDKPEQKLAKQLWDPLKSPKLSNTSHQNQRVAKEVDTPKLSPPNALTNQNYEVNEEGVKKAGENNHAGKQLNLLSDFHDSKMDKFEQNLLKKN